MTLWNNLLDMHPPTRSRRIARSNPIDAGEEERLSLDGAGCVRHWWTTYSLSNGDEDGKKAAHDIRLRIRFDGDDEWAVDQPLLTFFATLLDQEPTTIDAEPITVLEKNALNSWFPMPYSDGVEFSFVNENEDDLNFWLIVDIHQYDDPEVVPDERFKTVYRNVPEDEPHTFAEIAEFGGSGFVAGIAHGTDASDPADSWYHTGGDTWLLDGETDPHVIRGVGGEDVVGYSFGIHEGSHRWQGAPYVDHPDGYGSGSVECSFYRFFGPDPIVFDDSAIVKFGTQSSRIETTVYGYSDGNETDQPRTIGEWDLCGPFDGRTFEAFDESEFPEWEGPSDRTFEVDLPSWRPNPRADEDVLPETYTGRWESTTASRGWVDFLDAYAGIGYENTSRAGNGGAAYALGRLDAEEDGSATFRLAFDDWLKLWVNGNHVTTIRHDDGFETTTVDVDLAESENEVLLKLSNHRNLEYLAWAFNFAVVEDDCLAAQ